YVRCCLISLLPAIVTVVPIPVITPIPVRAIRVCVGTRSIVAVVVTVVWTPATIAVIEAEVDALCADRNSRHAEHGARGQSDCELLHIGSSFCSAYLGATNRVRACSGLNSILPDVGATIWRADIVRRRPC